MDSMLPAVFASEVHLPRRCALGDAFEALALSCVEQMAGNYEPAREGSVEGLHQMRVGLRRLRALLHLFQQHLQLPPGLKEQMDWLAAQLGQARDWDVLASSTLPDIGAGQRLIAAAVAGAVRQREGLGHTLHGTRAMQLVPALVNWLRAGAWRSSPLPGAEKRLKEPAREAAMPLLRQVRQRLRKRSRKLDVADAAARHRVRIAAKKMRYALEFFGSLLPRRRTRRCLGALKKVQDLLGGMNDAIVAEGLLAQLVERQPDLREEAAFVRGALAGRTAAQLAELARELRALRKRLPRRE
jgi:CHAD domain-containing protein